MFGNRIKELRKKAKLSQEELAIKMNISRSTVAMWETAQREPDFDSLKKLAEIFNVTSDYLLGRVKKPDRIVVYEEDGTEVGWAALIKEARSSGLTPEDMKRFLDAVNATKRKK